MGDRHGTAAGLRASDRRGMDARRAPAPPTTRWTRSAASRGRRSRRAAPTTSTARCAPRARRCRGPWGADEREPSAGGCCCASPTCWSATPPELGRHRDAATTASCCARWPARWPRCPAWYRYFAGLADKIHGDTIDADRRDYLIYTRHEPVGVVGAIVPWNSPLMLLTWKVAPALAAGCTLVAKPSDHTPVSTLELARRVEEAGLPPGVFNVVTGSTPEAGKALAAHPGVDKLAFTGSTAVGIQVAQAAMGHLAGVTLELGGKSAQVVFDDADLEAVDQRHRRRDLRRQRPDLHGGLAPARPRATCTTSWSSGWRRARGRSASATRRRRGHRDGPARQRAPVRDSHRLHRLGDRAGRHRRLRRRPRPGAAAGCSCSRPC